MYFLPLIVNPTGARELREAIKAKNRELFDTEKSAVYEHMKSVFPGSERHLTYKRLIDLASGDFVATFLKYDYHCESRFKIHSF